MVTLLGDECVPADLQTVRAALLSRQASSISPKPCPSRLLTLHLCCARTQVALRLLSAQEAHGPKQERLRQMISALQTGANRAVLPSLTQVRLRSSQHDAAPPCAPLSFRQPPLRRLRAPSQSPHSAQPLSRTSFHRLP